MKLAASGLIIVICLSLHFTPVSASGGWCERWSLHGYHIGMTADEALEVDLEGNRRAGVVKVKRNDSRIAFKYEGGGGGKVWFGPDGKVSGMRSSRSDAWDRPVPPPSSIVSYGEQARLVWLDKSCDVGIAMTRYRTDVTTSTAFLARPKNRYDLSVGSVEAAYLYGGMPALGTFDQRSYLVRYCGWPFFGCTLGDVLEAQRRAYWDWINHVECLKIDPRDGSRAELDDALGNGSPAARAPSGTVRYPSGGYGGGASGGGSSASNGSAGSSAGRSETRSLKRR
ncbi:MAG: hypothetical protein R3344_01675 [Acidobacteriota bacterium]|nr:hypothetical protein [Acidobacteriota bacterium]